MNGITTLVMIGLLFLAMYAYAYGVTYLEERQVEKSRQKRLDILKQKNDRLRTIIEGKTSARQEKYDTLRQRSLEIQQELKALTNMKSEGLTA